MSVLSDFKIEKIDGSGNLAPELKGKVVLAVNVASKCGLTPQYAGLERLHDELQDEGFTVVGLPCNQFGGQEPGTEQDIVQFCSTSYDVSFPMSKKLEVNGPGSHPLYEWLRDPANGFPGDIQWNFEKFLIGRDGKVAKRYPPQTAPDDKGLMQDIADLL